MSRYVSTTTQIAVHPEGVCYSDPDATIVTLLGELGEDEHFSIRQGEHVIYLDPEELPALVEACQQLQAGAAVAAETRVDPADPGVPCVPSAPSEPGDPSPPALTMIPEAAAPPVSIWYDPPAQ